ncbi:MAG: GldM family protein [Bacteroidota bacterium]
MKKQIVILIAFASIGLSALAQIKYSTAVVAATQMNIVYIGIQNPLSIAVPGYKQDSLIIKVSHGLLIKSEEPNTYLWSTKDSLPPRELIVSVLVKLPENVVLNAGDITFRVRQIPLPKLMLTSISHDVIIHNDSITLSQLKSTENISANLGVAFPYQGLKHTVTGYELYYFPKKGDLIGFNIQGSAITENIKKDVFEKVKSGDKIVISNARVIGPNREMISNLPRLVLYIK